MNTDIKLQMYAVYCDRNIIFKKYNKEISEVVRLDFNIDILPKDKDKIYVDSNKNKRTDVYYVDMSTNEFVVFNEDLKKCGYYDYNKEEIHYYKLPLNKKVTLTSDNKNIINKDEPQISINNNILNTKSYHYSKISSNNYQNNNSKAEEVVVKKRKGININNKNDNDDDIEDAIIKSVIDESLKDVKVAENKSVLSNVVEKNKSLSGIKAEERSELFKEKYKLKPKNKFETKFQDEEIRKNLT